MCFRSGTWLRHTQRANPSRQRSAKQQRREPKRPDVPLHVMNTGGYSVLVHWLTFLNRCRGCVGFPEFVCAFVAAHFNGLAADLDLGRIAIQRTIASSTSFCSHDCFSRPEVRVGMQ